MSTNHNKAVINRKHEHFDDEENFLLKSDIDFYKIRSVPFWNKICVCILAMMFSFQNPTAMYSRRLSAEYAYSSKPYSEVHDDCQLAMFTFRNISTWRDGCLRLPSEVLSSCKRWLPKQKVFTFRSRTVTVKHVLMITSIKQKLVLCYLNLYLPSQCMSYQLNLY